jgi:hypothetical protein
MKRRPNYFGRKAVVVASILATIGGARGAVGVIDHYKELEQNQEIVEGPIVEPREELVIEPEPYNYESRNFSYSSRSRQGFLSPQRGSSVPTPSTFLAGSIGLGLAAGRRPRRR